MADSKILVIPHKDADTQKTLKLGEISMQGISKHGKYEGKPIQLHCLEVGACPWNRHGVEPSIKYCHADLYFQMKIYDVNRAQIGVVIEVNRETHPKLWPAMRMD